jgi:P4 family phage/plasmid primase-like protien
LSTTPPESQPRPFADSVAAYSQAGWPCVMPVPPDTKHPPPTGFTGAEGRDTDPLQLVRWAGELGHYSVALRMPLVPDTEEAPGWAVIGIDVDQYVKKGLQKRGAETLARLIERWGSLPPTWQSTARGTDAGPGESGIRLYRVPARRYATVLKAVQADGTETGDIEIIQRHHRYTVVWPSLNPEAGAGARYRWYDPSDTPVDAPPKPIELPELPSAWVEGLAAGATEQAAASADVVSGQHLLGQLLDDERPECAEVTSARLTALDLLERSDAGSRHDTMTARVHHLVQLAASGHTGAGPAFEDLRLAWSRLTAGEERSEELERALLTSARKAVTRVGEHQVRNDPCLLVAGGFPLPAPSSGAPGPTESPDGDGLDVEIVEPPRWASVRELIGTQAFDPNAGTDQALAEAVLARTFPAIRYAYDTRSGWLLRAPDRWELCGDLTQWAVATVASLMPVGDPTAEKGTEPHERHTRRMRFMSNAPARAIAGKMSALVTGGVHPAAVALADLDGDPEVLWAGGTPWSLRASVDGPVPAAIDPATPHLRTASMAPSLRPTPLWDAFLEAVWPDAELRAWALRVLSIAVSGYADRALPILLGETGRGKTQVVALLMSVLGSYAHAANPKLLSPNSNEHDTIVFDLKGRRLSFIDEAPSEAKVGQERLKQLTGGGELTGRRMNQDPITYLPSHTFVLTSNEEPVLTDPAVRSRTRLIPCDGDPEQVRQARAAIGHLSGSAWRAEAPGVLAQMMAECARWIAEPTSAHVGAAPADIRYLAESIGAEQDPVAVWLTEETEYSETGTASRELYQAFTASCLRNNLRRDAIPSETKWGRALTRLGYLSMHTAHGKRRPLALRTGGFLPGMGTPPARSETPRPSVGGPETPTRQGTGQASTPDPGPSTGTPLNPDGFDGSADGLLTGSDTNPSGMFAQVNPSESVKADGYDGLKEGIEPSCARTHTREPGVGFSANPSADPSEAGHQAETTSEPEGPSAEAPSEAEPTPRKRTTKPRSAEATAKAAELREEKRLAAIDEAAGERLELPALVLRGGEVQPIDLAGAGELLATITGDESGALTVDVETTGFPIGHRDYALRTIQLGNEHFTVVLEAHDAEQAALAAEHLAAAAVLHAHSATADLVPLADAGLLDLESGWERMHDTVVLAKLADPASTGSDPGLKQISAAMLGDQAMSKPADEARSRLFKAGKWLTDTKITTALERSGWAQVDSRCTTMVRYAASDVLDDAAIARLLPRPAPEVLERERTAQRMTARVAYHGLRIDGEHTDRLLAEHTAARTTHAEQVRAFGIENPGSGPQVAAALTALGAPLPRTATGRPSVAEGVLDPLRTAEGPVGDLARAVLDYRHHDTAIGTFLEPYRQLVLNGDGRARPTVYTLGADTGRMSCVRPNLQQVPREGGFRACITADPGHLLVSADFSGVELRVAAALSGDTNLSQMIIDGLDLHGEVARQVWGPEATKAHRYIAKRGVFGRIYGGGVATLARQMGVSEALAQQMIDSLDHITPGLSEWSRQVREGVKAGRTQFPTYAGRVAHLPPDFPHKAPNYCIQGTARELLVDALLRWSATRWGGAVLLPVHDELVVMVPEDEAEEATTALETAMTTDLYGIPILAEASVPSYSWSDSV